MEENEEKFFLSFASDVQRFTESLPRPTTDLQRG